MGQERAQNPGSSATLHEHHAPVRIASYGFVTLGDKRGDYVAPPVRRLDIFQGRGMESFGGSFHVSRVPRKITPPKKGCLPPATENTTPRDENAGAAQREPRT